MNATVCTSCLRDLENEKCVNTTCLRSEHYIPPTVEELLANAETARRGPRRWRWTLDTDRWND